MLVDGDLTLIARRPSLDAHHGGPMRYLFALLLAACTAPNPYYTEPLREADSGLVLIGIVTPDLGPRGDGSTDASSCGGQQQECCANEWCGLSRYDVPGNGYQLYCVHVDPVPRCLVCGMIGGACCGPADKLAAIGIISQCTAEAHCDQDSYLCVKD